METYESIKMSKLMENNRVIKTLKRWSCCKFEKEIKNEFHLSLTWCLIGWNLNNIVRELKVKGIQHKELSWNLFLIKTFIHSGDSC